jgi:rod shape-determining protein MreD
MRPQLALVLVFAVAYQLLAIPVYQFGPIGPDLVLLVIAYVAFHERFQRAMVAALCAGLAVDFVSLEPWGVFTASYASVATVVAVGRRRGWSLDPLPRVMLSAAALLAASVVRLGITWSGDLADAQLVWVAGGAGYTVALAPAVYGLLDPVRRLFVPPDYRRLS